MMGLSILEANAQQQKLEIVKKDIVFLKEIIVDLQTISEKRKEIRSLIAPTILITYGFISLDNEKLQAPDISIKD